MGAQDVIKRYDSIGGWLILSAISLIYGGIDVAASLCRALTERSATGAVGSARRVGHKPGGGHEQRHNGWRVWVCAEPSHNAEIHTGPPTEQEPKTGRERDPCPESIYDHADADCRHDAHEDGVQEEGMASRQSGHGMDRSGEP